MWNWFKKDPVKRIGGVVASVAAVLLLLKISAIVGSLLFKVIFLAAIAGGAYIGYRKLMAKIKGERSLPELTEENPRVKRKRSSQKI